MANRMASSTPPSCCARCCSGFFTLGFFILFYWLIFQPHQIRAYVDSATLSTFSLSNATSAESLSYNLTTTLSLRNPNRRVRIYYDQLSAAAFYKDSQLGPTESDFSPFFQHIKSTTVVNPAFEGQQGNLSEEAREAFAQEKREGAYNLEVKLRAKLRHKVWFVKLRFKPKIDCWLTFPLTANGSASVAAPSKCDVDY